MAAGGTRGEQLLRADELEPVGLEPECSPPLVVVAPAPTDRARIPAPSRQSHGSPPVATGDFRAQVARSSAQHELGAARRPSPRTRRTPAWASGQCTSPKLSSMVVGPTLVARRVPEERAGEGPAVPRVVVLVEPGRLVVLAHRVRTTGRRADLGAPDLLRAVAVLLHELVELLGLEERVGVARARWAVRELVRVVGDGVEVRAAAELVDALEERQRRDLAVLRRAPGRGRRRSRSGSGRRSTARATRAGAARCTRPGRDAAPRTGRGSARSRSPNAARRAARSAARRRARSPRTAGVVGRALELMATRRRVPAGRGGDDRDDRHARAARAEHEPVGGRPVVDARAALDVAPSDAHPQPARAGRGHEVEVGLDVRRRLTPDELVAVREAGARAGDRERAGRGTAARRGAARSVVVRRAGGGRVVLVVAAAPGGRGVVVTGAGSEHRGDQGEEDEQDQRSTGAQGAHSVVEPSPSDRGRDPACGSGPGMLASNGCSL